MNVKIEGKNVQLLGDPMLNNCGPSGSPANAATMAGLMQVPEAVLYPELAKASPTPCTNGGNHRYEAHEAKGEESLEQKISTAKKDKTKGIQFEGLAAEHNMNSGELQRSSQLSGDTNAEKVYWKCAECGHSREGDQLHDGSTPGAAPIAVEVKSKSKLELHDLIQLGRNIKTVKQGGASGLIYKLPQGRAGKYIAYSIRAIGRKMGCAIRIVRV